MAAPTIVTYPIDTITSTAANIYGEISDDGGSPILTVGACWSQLAGPTLADQFTVDSLVGALWASTMAPLVSGLSYVGNVYATNADGTTYGTEEAFTTQSVPLVATGAMAVVSATSATVQVVNQYGGGSPWTERAVAYALGRVPNAADPTETAALGDGSPGGFGVTLTGLTAGALYGVRAKVTNGIGIGWGRTRWLKAGSREVRKRKLVLALR